MGDEKVVAFPGVVLTLDVVEQQLELFRRPEETSTYFSFVDVQWLDQESLLEMLATNAIVSLIDIRPVPVFKSPKFNHEEISKYLSDKQIMYFEYAMAASHKKSFSDFYMARVVRKNRNQGLTVCIYDDQAKEKGWLDRVRSNFRRSKIFSAELSPRSLTGYVV